MQYYEPDSNLPDNMKTENGRVYFFDGEYWADIRYICHHCAEECEAEKKPFRFADEKEKTDDLALPDGLSEENFRKSVAEKIAAMVQKALHEHLYIEQPSGLKVCRFTGRIVDPETR